MTPVNSNEPRDQLAGWSVAVSQKLLDVLLRAVFLPLDIGAMVVLTGVERVVNKAVWGGAR